MLWLERADADVAEATKARSDARTGVEHGDETRADDAPNAKARNGPRHMPKIFVD